MATDPEAKPTPEALEEERRRLKELERNLGAERDRIQAAAGREIAKLQHALRDAAERAARRERELESARRRLERSREGGRLGRLVGRRDREPQSAAPTSAERRELVLSEAELERKVDELVQVERRSVEQLAARAAVLADREAGLAEAIAALGQREQELAILRDELDAESGRLAARWARFGESERRAQVQPAHRARPLGFSEGLREFARKRGATC